MKTKAIRDIVAQYDKNEVPLLQVLLDVQDNNPRRYVSEEDINAIAYVMNISRSRVYSTASYYSEISLEPRGIHLIRVCVNAPCENAGKAEVQKALEEELGITIGQTTADGLFTLESVNCLGACYMSPAIKVDDTIHGYLTAGDVSSIINELREDHRNEQTA